MSGDQRVERECLRRYQQGAPAQSGPLDSRKPLLQQGYMLWALTPNECRRYSFAAGRYDFALYGSRSAFGTSGRSAMLMRKYYSEPDRCQHQSGRACLVRLQRSPCLVSNESVRIQRDSEWQETLKKR